MSLLRFPLEINRLDAGAAVPVAFSIPTPSEPGDLVITAFADCEDTVEESNEANNKRSTTVRLEAAPDLAVIEVEPQKEGYNAGETVTIRTVIVNQGNQDAGTFVVRLEADGTPAQTQTVPGLPIDLLIKARSQQFITKDVSLNASDISAERTGDVFAGEAQVSVVNLRGGYVLDTSALPSGSRVSGYTGKDGDTLRISIPASTATEKRTYTLVSRSTA